MRVLGRNHLVDVSYIDEESRDWVRHFLCEALHANWRRETDIIDNFPRSSRREDGTFIFRVNDRQTLHVAFSFHTATALILGVR